MLIIRKIGLKLFAMAILWSLLGCQALQPLVPGELALKDGEFLELWDAYKTCISGYDSSQMQESLMILNSAPRPITLNDSAIPIPDFLKKLSSSRNSRLAVDPRAMSASCTIHMAEVAQQSQDWNSAARILEHMISTYPEPQYSFYVSQAHRTLEQISSPVRPVALTNQESLVQ